MLVLVLVASDDGVRESGCDESEECSASLRRLLTALLTRLPLPLEPFIHAL